MNHDKAMTLLAEHSQGAVWAKHCQAVADVATRLGRALNGTHAIDHDFLRAAALLHDIGRHATHDPVRHGVAGYHLLMRLGHEQEAHVCASHVLFGLDAADAARFGLPARDFMPGTVEERVITLADFLVQDNRPTTLERRFSSLRRRYESDLFFTNRIPRAWTRARSALDEFEAAMGGSIEDLLAPEEGCG